MIYSFGILLRIDENMVYFISKVCDYGRFSYWKRRSMREFMTLAMREAVKSDLSDSGISFTTFTDDRFPFSLKVNTASDSSHRYFVAMVSDEDHSKAVCRKMTLQILRDFIEKIKPDLPPVTHDLNLKNQLLEEMLDKYQDPNDYCKYTKLRGDIDDVKEIMIENIDKVLQRGEKLDELVQKSADLSAQSKRFYKAAKRMNRCCFFF